MLIESPSVKRELKSEEIEADMIIIGGGLAGTCCAITAARANIKVVLVQDRPVLGGNSSSEVRLWVLGATSHMGNNNRWAREGGVINEILLENGYRNPDGNALMFDIILLEKVVMEKNITLLLNTAVYDIEKKDADTIQSVKAFCPQNSVSYILKAPLFCDASGDGIVGFLAGAAFRMGAESKDEFGEKFAPSEEYGELLGHSIYFYSKDTGRKVKYVPPSFAIDVTKEIPRYKSFNTKDIGCRLWWIEYGGRLDTVHETETIKWQLWKVVYGVWDYIKNSGKFPEAENLTLEWVGHVPGKRESRRFEGDYILKQQDVIEQTEFEDAVAFGGWSVDLHPADGVFSELKGCNQWHSKGVYGIPYRCYYSRNISNLFLAGRIISASHVAFGSTRVMATCAHGGQAIALAAALCKKYNALPKTIGKNRIKELQTELMKTGQHIPGFQLHDDNDLVQKASSIEASSTLSLSEIPQSGDWQQLQYSTAQMLPVGKQKMPAITFWARAKQPTLLKVQLRVSSKSFNHTPDVIVAIKELQIQQGENEYQIEFDHAFEENQYAFVCFMSNSEVELASSDKRITGLLSVYNAVNPAVSNYGKQEPTGDIGVEGFEFWCPQRRPAGKNIAMKITPALQAFSPEHLRNGLQRPVNSTNAWVADYGTNEAEIKIVWDESQTINKVELFFDADYDHPLESVLLLNPEDKMPFCADEVKVFNCNNELVGEISGNYLAHRTIQFDEPVTATELKIKIANSDSTAPVSLFEVRCY
ncbi:FAD-dependent oxidoreductase [Lacibacter sp. H375]|uniref:FAD-dependent oxidoreductase n=1 Tax=Lacibacter sp. H375 TaxID=3133424 RepID=UPI0030C5F6FC